MILGDFAKSVERFVTTNSPSILTALGVTGTLTSAYLTGKASFKAAELIAADERDREYHVVPPAELKEKVILTWKLYIPAGVTAVMTVTSIIFANRIGYRRGAAMAAAYSISERALVEYKDKVTHTIGKNKEQKIQDEIAQDSVKAHPVGAQQVIVTGGGDVLCYDRYTGRYFQSDMETLKKAQNETNYEILSQGYCSLSEFYNRIGLSSTTTSDDLGWNSDKLLELMFTTTMSDDNRPCIAMDFAVKPDPYYFRVH